MYGRLYYGIEVALRAIEGRRTEGRLYKRGSAEMQTLRASETLILRGQKETQYDYVSTGRQKF